MLMVTRVRAARSSDNGAERNCWTFNQYADFGLPTVQPVSRSSKWA